MNDRKELLAYCDLYCGDCAGHSGRLADTATELVKAFEAHEFDRTAECLFADEIPDYSAFRETLRFLTELRCEAPCRLRGEGVLHRERVLRLSRVRRVRGVRYAAGERRALRVRLAGEHPIDP